KQTHSSDAVLSGTVTSPVLSVSLAGAGTGTVASADTFINCGSTCTRTFTFGNVVTLTSAPIGSNTFAGWSGDCSGMGSCTLTMSSTKNVIATFNTPTASGDCTATPNAWCQTFPGTVALPATPPNGRS